MSRFAEILKEQFKITNCWFHWHSDNHFVESKWKWITWVKYLLIRWLMFVYCAIMMFLSIWEHAENQWIFALTSANYILITVYFLYAAVNITIYYIHQMKSACLDPCDNDATVTKQTHYCIGLRFRAHWFLYNLSLGMCTFVFIAFWVMLAPNKKRGFKPSLHTYLVIDRHGINLVLMVIDFVINRIPIRLLQFVYSSLFLGLYLVYNSIYWSQTGKLVYGKILDYGSNGPTVAALALSGMFIAIPLIQLLWFALTLLGKKEPVPREDANANLEFQNV